jgi:hypothetical protein
LGEALAALEEERNKNFMVKNSVFTFGNGVRVSCLMNSQAIEYLREAAPRMVSSSVKSRFDKPKALEN